MSRQPSRQERAQSLLDHLNTVLTTHTSDLIRAGKELTSKSLAKGLHEKVWREPGHMMTGVVVTLMGKIQKTKILRVYFRNPDLGLNQLFEVRILNTSPNDSAPMHVQVRQVER